MRCRHRIGLPANHQRRHLRMVARYARFHGSTGLAGQARPISLREIPLRRCAHRHGAMWASHPTETVQIFLQRDVRRPSPTGSGMVQ